MKKVLIPLIRKLKPQTFAQDLVGVQPMTIPTASVFSMGSDNVSFKNFVVAENQNECVLYAGNHVAVDVKTRDVAEWLEQQPVHLWKYAEETEGCHFAFIRYIIDEQLFTLLSLKWS